MRYIGKTQLVSYFRYVLGALLQQQLSFLGHPLANEGGSGVARGFLEHPVEVHDVHGQPVGVVFGRAQARGGRGAFQRKLLLQQLGKLAGYPACGGGQGRGGGGCSFCAT